MPGGGTRLAVGKPSVRPRLSPWTTSPSTENGAPSSSSAYWTAPPATRPRMWLELTTSPSTSSSGTTRVSKCSSAASSAASPWALWPKRKFSPTLTCVACTFSTSTWSMKSPASRAAKSPSNGMTTSSSTPSVATSSALRASVVSSRGSVPGATTDCGCGSNVTTASAPRMTSRWPRCTPSNVPMATRRGRGSTSGRYVSFTPGSLRLGRRVLGPAPRSTGVPQRDTGRPGAGDRCNATGLTPGVALGPEAYAGLRAAVRDERHAHRRALRVDEQHLAQGRRLGQLDDLAVPRAPGVLLVDGQRGQHATQRVAEGQGLVGGVSDREGPDGRAAQLQAVGVVQVGDQRAHVGARRAGDRERGTVALAPELLEAADLDLALGDHHGLPRPRQRVCALAADPDPAVGRRALSHPSGGQLGRVGRHHAGVDELALGVAGGRRPPQPRDGLIGLGLVHEEALRAGGAAQQDEEQAGGERVQRPGVADLDAARQATADPRDDVVRRRAGGLVDQQHPIHGARPRSTQASAERRPACAGS